MREVAHRTDQPTIETGHKERHHHVQLHQLQKSAVAEHKPGLGQRILLNNSTVLSSKSRFMGQLIRTGAGIKPLRIRT